MNEDQIQDLLGRALEAYNSMLAGESVACDPQDEDDVPIFSTQTFEDAGLLTNDKGVVLTLENESGSILGEFQITIVRSR